ncbi:MAG TPA: DUF3795 domain-containing protein [Candidatus Cloacimonetes bacterium]|nr:DUF3795 domain-containing protein [Candidatus Cloacimonadota bacterium]
MEKIIAACGIVCSACPAYIATLNDDEELRMKTAEQWSKMYGAPISADDIYCVGCLVEEGRHIGHCAECDIRKCVMDKELLNCAYCDDYGCEKIAKFHKMVPEAKAELGAIRDTF